MKLAFSIIICKLLNSISRIFNKSGSVIGGYWALKIYPNVLSKIKLPKYVIGVSGSSGKGSTTELIAHILSKSKYTLSYNKTGSNAINGIASLILMNTSIKGVFKNDVLLMELDEKYMCQILKYFDLTHLVLTNITRDQPPRNTHPEKIWSFINGIIKDNTTLVLNVDDPFIYRFAIVHPQNNIIYYGMEKNSYSSLTKLNNIDGAYCPICNKKLKYKFYHYGHLGNYVCPNKDFFRPKPDYLANHVDIENMKIKINSETISIPSNFLYSVYFTTAAYALCSTIGIDKDKLLHSINVDSLKPKRLNIYNFYNRKWQLLSSKNENNLSYKQSLDFILHEKGKKTIILGFDNSSRRYEENDVSWIWDIDFEELDNQSIDKIIVIGKFRYDVLTRLEYAGIKRSKLILCENTEEELIDIVKKQTIGNIYSMVCFDKEIVIKSLLAKEGVYYEN